jgi:polyisoprenyl-phosphate glycosyltransferase
MQDYISITFPVYNEEENLLSLYEKVVAVLEEIGQSFELVFVDNGSNDNSLKIIKELRKNDKRVKYLCLSKNYGHQGGIYAGLKHSTGSAVISMDSDLQHPPEMIPKMIEYWKSGYEIVFTIKNENKGISFMRRFMIKWFYKIISKISDLELVHGQSDFRLLDRKIVEILCNIPERKNFIRGIVDWVGFKKIGIEYDVNPRLKGQSKFSMYGMSVFALNGICSFSLVPLRMFIYIGVLLSFSSSLFGIYIIARAFTKYFILDSLSLPPGWLSVVLSILFLGSVQLLGIGILGEYIGLIFEQIKLRPEFIVMEKELDNENV